ncbi:MAG: histidine phosphatase family protein [Planctomycetes bacterium]|nr:histidine phosphatase family protein [Planctomycetota bacterium]
MARLLLLRHGETRGESSVRYWGRTDVPLSRRGREMARAAGRLLLAEPIGRLITSRLSRSRECGQLALSGRRVPGAAVPEFDEIDFGRWEGLTRAQIAAQDAARFAEWEQAQGDFAFPGGESRAQFEARVRRGFEQLDPGWLEGCALFALHRGVIRNLLHLLLGEEDGRGSFDVDLGALTILEKAEGASWSLEVLNRTDFF